MPIPTVPRFEDPAFAVDAPDPSRAPQWGVSPKLNFDAPNGQLFMFNDAGEFILNNPATDLEQLVVKSIITERLTYAAYDKEFGSDFTVAIGRQLSDLAVQSLAERYIREALSPIDLIRAVDQVATQIRGDTLYVSFRVVAVSGYEKEFSFARTIK
jgi:phage gp46-like protein